MDILGSHRATGFGRLEGHQASPSSAQGQFYLDLSVSPQGLIDYSFTYQTFWIYVYSRDFAEPVIVKGD